MYIAAIGRAEGRNDSTAISAKNGSDYNTVNVSGNTVQLIGSLDVSGSSKNTINVDLSGKDSFWYGSAIGQATGTINISLSDGASWIFNASGSSLNRDGELSNLTLNGGVVILNDDIIWEKYNNTVIKGTNYVLADYRNKDANYHSVEIGNLQGKGGIFVLDLNAFDENGEKFDNKEAVIQQEKTIFGYTFYTYGTGNALSDVIYVENSEENSKQYIVFNAEDAGISRMDIGDRIYFAAVEDGNVAFDTVEHAYQNSGFVYDYIYGTGSELSAADNPDYPDANAKAWYVELQGKKANENSTFAKGAAFASYSLATDMDRFNDRRGESRYVSDTDDGLWVRYAYTDLGWYNAFDMDKHMVQLGYDRQFAEAYGKHYFGASFDYTDADIDIDNLSGDNKADRYALSLYYTWLSDNGTYVDIVLKGGIVDSDYHTQNRRGEKIGGDFDQWFYGASAETGYKFAFDNQIFVEPQAQLQFIHLEGDHFTSDSGIKAKIDDTNSLIGRAGFRAGYDFSLSGDLPDSSVYIKADVLHEFSGDREYTLTGTDGRITSDFSGDDTWYDAGIGIDLSVTDNTKLWVDAEHIFGADYDSTWQVNAGARYEF